MLIYPLVILCQERPFSRNIGEYLRNIRQHEQGAVPNAVPKSKSQYS